MSQNEFYRYDFMEYYVRMIGFACIAECSLSNYK